MATSKVVYALYVENSDYCGQTLNLGLKNWQKKLRQTQIFISDDNFAYAMNGHLLEFEDVGNASDVSFSIKKSMSSGSVSVVKKSTGEKVDYERKTAHSGKDKLYKEMLFNIFGKEEVEDESPVVFLCTDSYLHGTTIHTRLGSIFINGDGDFVYKDSGKIVSAKQGQNAEDALKEFSKFGIKVSEILLLSKWKKSHGTRNHTTLATKLPVDILTITPAPLIKPSPLASSSLPATRRRGGFGRPLLKDDIPPKDDKPLSLPKVETRKPPAATVVVKKQSSEEDKVLPTPSKTVKVPQSTPKVEKAVKESTTTISTVKSVPFSSKKVEYSGPKLLSSDNFPPIPKNYNPKFDQSVKIYRELVVEYEERIIRSNELDRLLISQQAKLNEVLKKEKELKKALH